MGWSYDQYLAAPEWFIETIKYQAVKRHRKEQEAARRKR